MGLVEGDGTWLLAGQCHHYLSYAISNFNIAYVMKRIYIVRNVAMEFERPRPAGALFWG
jgi:hypothetical protein